MSHSHRAIPDVKFEFGTFSIFGDMTHKLYLSKSEQVIKFIHLIPGNGFKVFKKLVFYYQGHSF